jgi:hypothetical protein
MAVPYENMTDEARRRQRQDRLRMRVVWPRDTQEGRLYYESAKAIASMWEACEDAIVGLGGDERGKEETAIGVLRQAVGQARQAYKRLDMAAKLGLNAVDKVFDRTAGVQDLDEEEEKLVKAFLKEEGSAGGGKVQKKREHAAKPYDRSEDEIGRVQPSPSAGVGGYGGGAGHMFNWGMGQQQQYPFAMPMTAPSFGGGIPDNGGVVPDGNDDAVRINAHARRNAGRRTDRRRRQEETSLQHLRSHGPLEISACMPEFSHAFGAAGCEASSLQATDGTADGQPERDSGQSSCRRSWHSSEQAG